MLLLITLFFSFLASTTNEVSAEIQFFTGSKTMEITDYSVVKEGLCNQYCIESDPFTVGGYQWAIQFFPNGLYAGLTGYVSIAVKLVYSSSTKAVSAMNTNRLKDWNTGGWSNSTPYTHGLQYIWPYGMFDQSKFIKHYDLEASDYLRNNTLVIKTTVWVMKNYGNGFLPALVNGQQNLTTADQISFENRTNQAH